VVPNEMRCLVGQSIFLVMIDRGSFESLPCLCGAPSRVSVTAEGSNFGEEKIFDSNNKSSE
jgi:hypothetical protein